MLGFSNKDGYADKRRIFFLENYWIELCFKRKEKPIEVCPRMPDFNFSNLLVSIS